MASNPLDALKKAQTITEGKPAWKEAADRGITGGMDLLRGFTGLGDQGPAGPTAINLGQLLGAAIPLAKRLPFNIHPSTPNRGPIEALVESLHGRPDLDPPAEAAAREFFGVTPRPILPGYRVDTKLKSRAAGEPRPSGEIIGPTLRELEGMDYDQKYSEMAPMRKYASKYTKQGQPSTVRPGAWKQEAPSYDSKFALAGLTDDWKLADGRRK